MPTAARRMGLETITLSEVRKGKAIPYNIIYMWNLKYDTNDPWDRNILTDREQLMVAKRQAE